MPFNRDKQADLNSSMPAASNAKMGDVLNDLITNYNLLAGKFNALCAKLDADVGVTDVNYVSLQGGASSITTLANR